MTRLAEHRCSSQAKAGLSETTESAIIPIACLEIRTVLDTNIAASRLGSSADETVIESPRLTFRISAKGVDVVERDNARLK